MKNILTLLLLAGLCQPALAQKSTPAPVISRYLFFTGTIDKYPVTFHLYQINNALTGVYYYNSTEEPIYVSGTVDNKRLLLLKHYNNEGEEQETLYGSFKDSIFSGTWSSKGKKLPFRVAKEKNNNGLSFDYIYTAGTKKIAGDPNGRTAFSFDAAVVWPTATTQPVTANLVKKIVYESFGIKQGNEPIGKVMIREKNDLLNQKINKEDGQEAYSLSKIIKVQYRNPRLLTLSSYSFVDGGGAHGNHGTSYSCLDLVNNRELAITDVIDTLRCSAELSRVLENKFRTAYGVATDEKISQHLLVDVIKANDNFSLTSKGIQFNYTPYEIGAYAMGEISLYIPYKEVAACLQPGFKELMKL